MRSWLPLVILAFLAAGCGLLPTTGTRATYTVTNLSNVPVVLTVKTRAGLLPGAVLPAALDPRATGKITFLLPPGTDYWIMVNETPMFPGGDVEQYLPERCAGTPSMQVDINGSGGIGCDG
jgi:hypothetical protein